MRSPNINDLRKAVEAVPDEEKLGVLKGYFLLVDILNTPTPGTEPMSNGTPVDLARLNEVVGSMRPGEHKPAEITAAYGWNGRAKEDKKKIMDEVKSGRVARIQYTKPVRSTIILL